MNPDQFYKYAVITGGLGYIGRNLSIYLEKNGWEVILLVRKSSAPKRIPFGNYISLIEYDGTEKSLSSLGNLDRDRTVFFHLAASMKIDNEIKNTAELIDSNISLGMSLAAYMAQKGFKFLVSTESYWQFDEQGILGGNTLYASTKSACSLLFDYMAKDYLTVISLVLYDVYGPSDTRGKLINNLLDSVERDQTFDMTEGEQVIDYVHIDDVVTAYQIAADQLLSTDMLPSFNRYTVRTMRPLQLRGYIRIIEQTIGKPLSIRWGVRGYQPFQIMRPWLPASDHQLPGWEPTIPFEAGIRGLANID